MPRLNADARHIVTFTLNGKPARVEVETRTAADRRAASSASVLPARMSVANTVSAAPARSQIDGVPARACLTLAVLVEGADIRTIEGLAPAPDRLGPLQAAFRRHHALQCGFCTAGILMSLDSYLKLRPAPTRAELTEVIGGHLCRCTGYAQIIDAAWEAAAELRGETREAIDDHA